MKLVRDTTKRFRMRPHYAPAELDQECERIVQEFLRRRHGKIDFPISTDDLTVLIEQEAEDLDLHADLSRFGETVDGVTIFAANARPAVRISSRLAGDDSRENRLRTTLTHEYGHVHFHAYLFDRSSAMDDLFEGSTDARKPVDNLQVCKRETMVDANQADWMEWQAGHVCGAILMPAGQTKREISEHFGAELNRALPRPGDALGIAAVRLVMSRFAVSEQAARVRLLRLGVLVEGAGTGSLIAT